MHTETERTRQMNLQHAEVPAKSMQAITQHAYGSAEVLRQKTIEIPVIGTDDVLIEVRAAGLDRGTWHLMAGKPYLIRALGFGLTRPKQRVPGLDVAGRVVSVGKGVTRFSINDEVFGIAKGSFAEYASALEDKLVLKPKALSYKQAAAATVSGITALEALTDIGNVKKGQRVLIVGASGGVGSFAVQIAKAKGAIVTGICSAEKMESVLSLGANEVIDYKTNYFEQLKNQYDLIIDIGGRNRIANLRSLLKRDGTLVFVGGEGGNDISGGIGRQIRGVLMSPFLRHNLKMFVSAESGQMISRLCELIQSGRVTPSINHEYSLNEVRDAMQALEAGQIKGKCIVVVRPQ